MTGTVFLDSFWKLPLPHFNLRLFTFSWYLWLLGYSTSGPRYGKNGQQKSSKQPKKSGEGQSKQRKITKQQLKDQW